MTPQDEAEILASLRLIREALADLLEIVAAKEYAWKVHRNDEMIAKLRKYEVRDVRL